MSLEKEVAGAKLISRVNRFLNKTADRIGNFTNAATNEYNNAIGIRQLFDRSSRRELGSVWLFTVAGRGIEALASLSASITGGRKPSVV